MADDKEYIKILEKEAYETQQELLRSKDKINELKATIKTLAKLI